MHLVRRVPSRPPSKGAGIKPQARPPVPKGEGSLHGLQRGGTRSGAGCLTLTHVLDNGNGGLRGRGEPGLLASQTEDRRWRTRIGGWRASPNDAEWECCYLIPA